MQTRNPFLTRRLPSGTWIGAASADDRIHLARRFTAEQCRAALETASLQASVRRAVEIRLKSLEKGRAND